MLKYTILLLLVVGSVFCEVHKDATSVYDESRLKNYEKFMMTPVHKNFNVEKTAGGINSGIYICD